MSAESFTIIALFVVFVGAFSGYSWRKRVAARRAAEEQRQHNLEVQAFVLSKLDGISKLLEQGDLPASELKSRSDALLDEMNTVNADGVLDPLIDDTRNFIQEQIDKQSGGAPARKPGLSSERW